VGWPFGILYVVILGINDDQISFHLEALEGQFAKHLVLVGGASVTGFNQKLRDGVLAASGQPGHGADGLPLTKEMEDLGASLSVQLFMAGHQA